MDPQELANLAHLRRARDLIDREYARPLDVPTMARHALMSPAHFSRRFRAAYGETPYSYLMTRRIERAMTLLRGGMSVTDACMTVGCTSLGSFSSRFTEVVGETPSAYRGRAHDAVTAMPACVAKVYTRPSRNPVPGADAVSDADAPRTSAPSPEAVAENMPSRIREAGRTAAA
ncbi:helix-turn-helix transcriptional regulator [Streptomyces sp. NPDC000878]